MMWLFPSQISLDDCRLTRIWERVLCVSLRIGSSAKLTSQNRDGGHPGRSFVVSYVFGWNKDDRNNVLSDHGALKARSPHVERTSVCDSDAAEAAGF
jgi:hypothetical protein